MRSYLVLATLVIAAVACEGRHTLTGPDAQRAVAEARTSTTVLPTSTLVFVDGKRMPAGILGQLDPKTITRIEVLKGEVAVATYGEAGRAGVINIFTRAGQADSASRQ